MKKKKVGRCCWCTTSLQSIEINNNTLLNVLNTFLIMLYCYLLCNIILDIDLGKN